MASQFTRMRRYILVLSVLGLRILGGILDCLEGTPALGAEAFDFTAWAKTDRLGLLAGDGKTRTEASKTIGERANPDDILGLIREINANKTKIGSTMYLIDTLRAATISASRIKKPSYTKELVELMMGDCLTGSAVNLHPIRASDGSRSKLPPSEVVQRKNGVLSKAVLPALEQFGKEGALKELRGDLLKSLKQLIKDGWLEEANKKDVLSLVGRLSIESE